MGNSKEGKQLKYEINIFLIKYFKWLTLCLSAIIILAGYFLLIGPKYKEIASLRPEIEKKQKEYEDQKAALAKLKEQQVAYKMIDPKDIDKIKMLLPNMDKREELLPKIELIVSKNGFLLTSLAIGDKDADTAGSDSSVPEGVRAIKISMDVTGTDYIGLKNLLASLENSIRLIDIVKLSFSPQDRKTSLEALVYYKK